MFKPITNYENEYLINEYGQVFSLISNKLLTINIDDNGYCYVILYKNSQRKLKRIHRLVAEEFIIKNDINKNEVNHIDGNKSNNFYKNLEWCTRSENMIHAYKNNLEVYKYHYSNPWKNIYHVLFRIDYPFIMVKENLKDLSLITGLSNSGLLKHEKSLKPLNIGPFYGFYIKK